EILAARRPWTFRTGGWRVHQKKGGNQRPGTLDLSWNRPSRRAFTHPPHQPSLCLTDT
ncbi:hypothetical protein FQA47_025311, partial [Oryzias melastigma]